MPDPQLPPSLAEELREIRRRLRELETSSRLVAASIGSGGIRVRDGGSIRSEEFDGQDLDNPGTDGWWLGPEGLIVNRAVIRTGSLVRVAYADALDGVMVPPNISTDFTVYATATIDVPDWATRAQVLAFGQGTGVLNQADSESAIFVRVDIGDVESQWAGQSMQFTSAVSITEGTAAANLAAELTGGDLGSTIECDLLCHQASSGTPMLLNMGSVSAVAIFTDD